jgi:hypothetical protein
MWIAFVIGAFVGACFVLGIIWEGYEVHKKGWWEEYSVETSALRARVQTLTAENASLRVALAAGEMTEEGKKVASLTMAVLGGVSTAASAAIQESKPSSKPSQ